MRSQVQSSNSQETLIASLTPSWYALQTRYQCEKRVDIALRREGFESFAPVRHETRNWSDRTKLIELPLFPGYAFVRTHPDPELLSRVLRLPGTIRFITRGRDLVAVADEEIETVRILSENGSCEEGPFPAIGERIKIRGGCLEGLEGVLLSHTDKREIVVSIHTIQRSLKIVLGNYQIEPLRSR